ncbi:hypothetical protein SNE35_29760 [Paucibacter sp. R3-3]|uniref:AAA+ ATPase domain-containing protein n=1 Tax=Roseateles agri TaxID=3098619 RepID=A0ABU5DTV4_9BURK|nr:hypothetical protein [Paucibacter sp. R3-3]MDY0748722.1 hypothetical protein [Paucibacter sp. R3-3]
MATTAWPVELALGWTDDEIKNVVRLPGEPIPGLMDMRPGPAAEALERGLGEIFEPSDGVIAALRKIVDAMRSHLLRYYGDRGAYLRGINAKKSPLLEEDVIATCITGLQGVGKSALGRALGRLMATRLVVEPGSGYPSVSFEMFWHVKASTRTTLRSLLEDPLAGCLHNFNSLKQSGDFSASVSRAAYRMGVLLAFLDELQFLTQSENANSLITKLLHGMRYLGLPLFYVTNYSVARRLLSRPPEDQYRLLANPIIVRPDVIDSKSSVDLDRQYTIVSNGALLSKREALLEQMQEYTGGLHRAKIRLLSLAFKACRERSKNEVVSSLDLQSAFRSVEYANFRRDADILRKQAVTGTWVDRNYWCPFDTPGSPSPADSVRANAEEKRRTQQQALLASLKPDETAKLKDLQHSEELPTKEPTARRRPSATADMLKQGHEFLQSQKQR